MSSGGRQVKWGDIATLEYGKALRGYQNAKGPYRVFGTNGAIGWHDEPLCHHSGVIVGRKGAYRGIHYSPQPFYVIDTAFYLEPKKDIDLRWAYYCLLTYDINSMDSGSAIPSTSRDAFYSLPVCVPPLDEQRAIAHILGSFDDKIELNKRLSKTLEGIAQAIFKSWFIDFDPVKAKMDGREPYGLKREIADLFPSRLVESELGPIPEGWRVGSVGDVANHPRRSMRSDEIGSETPYIGLEHMPRGSTTLSEWGCATGLQSNKYAFRRGEILFGKLRPYFHKVGVAPVDGVCSTDIVVIEPKHADWFGFVLGHVSSVDFVNYTDACSTGTRMPRTSWKDMARYEMAIPPVPLALAFTTEIRPLVERCIAATHENHTLAQIRDTLLPKLISGEIRVPDAERFLEVNT